MHKRFILLLVFTATYIQLFAQTETQNPTFPFWKVNGNSGTNPATNFIGTTDGQKLIFKVNNTHAGIIEHSAAVANTGLGYKALQNNTTGYSNTALGFLALAANTTGFDNFAFGDSALNNNTTGFHNVAVGALALGAITNGSANTGIGYAALKLITGDVGNTAVGDYALTSLSSGSGNVALGLSVMSNRSSGSYNVGIGRFAMLNSNTGSYNVGIGYNSLYNITGSDNVALGPQSLSAASAASGNVAIGSDALGDCTTGDNNVAIGFTPLSILTTGANNIAIGVAALQALTTGGSNVAIGKNADVTSGTINNSVAIGSNAQVSASGCIVLGNVANVGIGISGPTSMLHTVAQGAKTANYTGNLLTNVATSSTASINKYGLEIRSTGSWSGTSASNTGLYVSSVTGGSNNYDAIFNGGGYVGIGLNNPIYPLQVSGSNNQTITYGYYNNSGTGGVGSGNVPISIYASNRIVAAEFNAVSDQRIKQVIGRSNNTNDLQTLSNIQITDYRFIDTIEKGSRVMKKVIAQELEMVYPNAVTKMRDVVPDIYQIAEVKNGRVLLSNNLKAGERVKLILKDKAEIFEIITVDKNSFEIDGVEDGKVFVYGREVNDFRTVDYEALSTLNISATQELLKRLEALEQENTIVKAHLVSLTGDVESIKQTLKQVSAMGR